MTGSNPRFRQSEYSSSGRTKQDSQSIRVELRYSEHKKIFKKRAGIPRTSSALATNKMLIEDAEVGLKRVIKLGYLADSRNISLHDKSDRNFNEILKESP